MATASTRILPLPADVRLARASANALLVLGGLLLLAWGVAALARLSIFTIRGIALDGDLSRNSVATVRANALPRLSGSFFTLDLARARAAFESVPWVRRAVVSRRWPDQLAVRLEEHKPAAVWMDAEGNERVVNTHGEVFDANVGDVEDDGLPSFSGPDGSSARMLALYQALVPVFRRIDAGIELVELSGRGSWRVELDTGAEIELGRGDDAELLARTERFVRTVSQVTGRHQRPLEHADLRHADGYAVRLKGIRTTTTSSPTTTNATP